MSTNRNEWGDGPDYEPREVEWEVSGCVDCSYINVYIRSTSAELAEQEFRDLYEELGCNVEDVVGVLSEYQ